MIRLKQVRVGITDKSDIRKIIVNKLKIKNSDLISYKIHKKSIDARNKKLFSYVYDFDVTVKDEDKYLKYKNVEIVNDPIYELPKKGSIKLNHRPIVIGFGPAGLFASYYLAKMGYEPIVFERGKMVEERIKDVDKFWQEGILNKNSNVQFGEGGAGTFSDGKLNTLVKDKMGRMQEIFKVFVECGAPEEIMYDNKPHIGTDILQTVIKNMRNKIIDMGGSINYNSMMQEIIIENNKVKGIIVNDTYYDTDILVLAIGHSARETFEHLYSLGCNMEAKPLAIGVRIMHDQDFINKTQYPINYPFLPSASYKLTYNTKDKRGIYSFCMCPGGYVVDASSSNNHLVINGMSNYKRDSGVANSAIVVTVGPNDFGNNPLDGVRYLEDIENKAFKLTKGLIPVQKFIDYNNNIESKKLDDLKIKGRYISANINKIFPDEANKLIKEGINHFNTLMPGFSNGIIAAPETRTSSPVKVIRNDDLESNILGIYPCGEGSGYAGGITTSAIDGLKVFESIVKKYYW